MKARLSLFVFVDALGWELTRKLGFLDDVLLTRNRLETVLGYSATCIPTILTGRMPQEHGHLSFFRYDPQASPFAREFWLRLLPEMPGRIRRHLSRLVEKRLGYTGYFQLYSVPFRYLRYLDYTEKRDLYQPGGINGAVPTIFDVWREAGTPFFLADWRQSERTSVERLEAEIREGDVEMAYLYLASMDAILHAEGTSSPRAHAHLRGYERTLRRLLDLARRHYGDVDLYIFSDHGMTDIEETCDLSNRIGRLGLRYGRDYAAVYDSTMARFWFHSDVARDRILACLRDEPRGRILTDAELSGYGCKFDGREYGEIIFLLQPGVLMCPSFMGRKPIAGMHGYAPEDSRSAALFASNRNVAQVPRRLDDLFGLMKLNTVAEGMAS